MQIPEITRIQIHHHTFAKATMAVYNKHQTMQEAFLNRGKELIIVGETTLKTIIKS